MLTGTITTTVRRSRPRAVVRAAKRSQIVLYPFSIEQGLDRRRAPQRRPTGDAKRLEALAGKLGGRAFYPRTETELLVVPIDGSAGPVHQSVRV